MPQTDYPNLAVKFRRLASVSPPPKPRVLCARDLGTPRQLLIRVCPKAAA
jgi:hypothetical protein